jgi:molybdopterin-guanine dinucleotide biosynthesis protein A
MQRSAARGTACAEPGLASHERAGDARMIVAPDPGGANVTAVILCGGLGKRVGGADKPLLPFRGRALVEQVVSRVTPQVRHVLISANRNLERYAEYGEVVRDALEGHQGPLAGVAAALTRCQTDWLLVCPGDAPNLPRDLVHRLATGVQASGTRIPVAAIPHDGERLQPLPVLMHRSVRDDLTARLESGERGVQAWLATLSCAEVRFPGAAAAFASRNTHADLADPDHDSICDCR